MPARFFNSSIIKFSLGVILFLLLLIFFTNAFNSSKKPSIAKFLLLNSFFFFAFAKSLLQALNRGKNIASTLADGDRSFLKAFSLYAIWYIFESGTSFLMILTGIVCSGGLSSLLNALFNALRAASLLLPLINSSSLSPFLAKINGTTMPFASMSLTRERKSSLFSRSPSIDLSSRLSLISYSFGSMLLISS
ncbi:hypothetical protein CCS77_2038 (plasmid) [Campylobacter concisus]|uniref:Uncharacterized protein n=1 Tax=Campylobacter concisus TaxID=199 RepID=A0A2R4P305_9BACT|nr:hypothetical protein CCS77_2038 [Campylobacter concisus]